jgi:uncharacterized protein YjeT (DUF2065 family)
MHASAIAAWFVAAVLTVSGLSHLLHPRAWSAFFTDAFRWPGTAFVIGLLSFMTGLLIVLAHPAWPRRPEALVTLIGWGWTIKGALYQLAPAVPMRLAAPNVKRPGHFRWAGGLLVVLGIAIGWDLLGA